MSELKDELLKRSHAIITKDELIELSLLADDMGTKQDLIDDLQILRPLLNFSGNVDITCILIKWAKHLNKVL